jgi:hypothetical protein
MAKTLEEVKLADGISFGTKWQAMKVASMEPPRSEAASRWVECYQTNPPAKKPTNIACQSLASLCGESRPLRIGDFGRSRDVVCSRCGYSFHSKPGFGDKPGGRCQCGGWICPACLACQGTEMERTPAGFQCA